MLATLYLRWLLKTQVPLIIDKVVTFNGALQVESQVSVLTDQMVKLLAYLETIQASGLSSDDRGRRVGSDITLDFFAASTSTVTKSTV